MAINKPDKRSGKTFRTETSQGNKKTYRHLRPVN